MKVYILSPHIDDAAYGLTLTISRLVHSKISVTIVNCFTLTKWTIRFVSKDMDEICRLRKKEDIEYNKLFDSSIGIINLDLLDAPLRNDYIFQYKPFDEIEWQVVKGMENYFEKNIDGILLCPLGIGNHIDHAICREAVARLYSSLKVLFFEDLPYANRITEAQIFSHVNELEQRLQVPLISQTNGLRGCNIDKEQAIRLYKTQLNDEICSEILSHMKNLQGERLWGEEHVFEELKKELKC